MDRQSQFYPSEVFANKAVANDERERKTNIENSQIAQNQKENFKILLPHWCFNLTISIFQRQIERYFN